MKVKRTRNRDMEPVWVTKGLNASTISKVLSQLYERIEDPETLAGKDGRILFDLGDGTAVVFHVPYLGALPASDDDFCGIKVCHLKVKKNEDLRQAFDKLFQKSAARK